MSAEDRMRLVGEVVKLRPKRGEVLVVNVTEPAADDELIAFSAQLAELAESTNATVLLLPYGVDLDQVDDREMAARGWLRIGPLCHTPEQLGRQS